MIGLSIVAAIFIVFALVASFVVPRRYPDFPGKNGIGVFAIVAVVLFAAQITAVLVFGVEKEAKAAEHGSAAAGPPHTLTVQENEFKIILPPTKTLTPGSYTFVVQNAGKIPHDLAVEGPDLSGPAKTPTIAPGQSAKLTVSLGHGTYQLYCTIPGHRAAGMLATIAVG
jgi:uncharacterized cupredoxin-like copper-binding protein